ncbi:MAG: hypothetical protein KDA53_13365 [Hyphomonas sp.]|nr:hypothetical protein [Hyphomonas sp.]
MDLSYDRGLGGALTVTLLEDRIRIHTGRNRSKELRFDDIRALRYVTTQSPQRSDYTLLLEGKGRTLDLNYVKSRIAGSDPIREAGFNHVVSKTLAAVAAARPDLEVISGRAPLAATLIFLCFALPALLAAACVYLFIGEPGGTTLMLSAAGIGLLSAIFAWRARPWKAQERIAAGELASLFEPATAS